MKTNLFQKVFLVLISFLVLFYTFWLGVDVERGDTKEMISDGVLLAFWLFALVFFVIMYQIESKLDRDIKKMQEEIDTDFEKLIADLKRDEEKRIAGKQKFADIFREVTGKDFYESKTVSAKHIAQIQKRYTEATGRYATINVMGGGVINVNLSDTPPAPAKKKAPVKKPVAKKPTVTKKGK